jgi:hypothetical protein
MPRIKLKMGTVVPEPTAQRLSLKLSGQGSDIAYKDNNQPSSVTIDDESLKRQRDHVRTESAGQDVSMSPRTRSFRRNIESPGSSAATTPASSEQHQGSLAGAQDMSYSVKNETPMAIAHIETGTSQNFPGLFAEASATEIAQHSSGSGKSLLLAILAILWNRGLCSASSTILTSS